MTRDRDAADEPDVNIYSGDGEDGEETAGLFEPGQPCDVCGKEGRIGIDPTARGTYDGTPVLACHECAPQALKDAFAEVQGMSVIVEPFGDYDCAWYYRLDEMASYQFVREDLEAISWLFLTIGGPCSRCGEQSRHAWLTDDFVDPRLPEGAPVFRNLDGDSETLCNACAAGALAEACVSLDLPLIAVDVPRSAMGIIIPTGE